VLQIFSIYYYIFSTAESDCNSNSSGSEMGVISMFESDRFVSDYDDPSSDSENSVDTSQAKQWTEMDMSKIILHHSFPI
jgi:hypothetical protein